MSFACPRPILLATALSLLFSNNSDARELRVCADPNNLPFSNARGEGFENEIAELIAKELGANLSYFCGGPMGAALSAARLTPGFAIL